MSITVSQRRRLAVGFALCSIAILALLGGHPADAGGPALADLLRSEAGNRVRDGLIHGGFIFVSWMLIVCFVFLSQALGFGKVRVVAGLVAFCIGTLALMASMTVDGLVTPAIASRFLDPARSSDLAGARALFLLCGSAIRILMPMGLLFQALAMACWSAALAGPGWRLAAGGFGLLTGISYIAATFLLPGLGAMLLMGGIALLCLWYLVIAVLLWTWEGWPQLA